MASYPGEVYGPRAKENKSGVVYDADKKTIGYVEDVTKLDDEVVAIETELGLNPKGDYADVKTLLAELTDIKKSKARAYASLAHQSLGTEDPTKIILDTENYDGNDEFDNTDKTGTATATTAFHLIDTTKNQFTAEDVGREVGNPVDSTHAKVTGYNSESDLTLDTDIMEWDKTYHVYASRFTAKKAGYYQVSGGVKMFQVSDGEYQRLYIYKNGAVATVSSQCPGYGFDPVLNISDIIYLGVGGYVELWAEKEYVLATSGGESNTFLAVHRLS